MQSMILSPVVPPEEPVDPVVPADTSVVEHPNAMEPTARYRKNSVHRNSVQTACKVIAE